MDSSKLKVDIDAAIIVPRALFFSTIDTFEKDIDKLEQLYSEEEILTILTETTEAVSNEVCELIANRYSAPLFHRFSR
jgi:hypothetical protein